MGRNICRIKKIVISGLLCGIMVFSASCGADKKAGSANESENSTRLEVWSKCATINGMQDVASDKHFKKDATYTVSAARGEYEGAQLIITAPSNKNVSAYTLEVSDLTCGEYVIDKSYIDVYNEKYIEVTTSPAEVSTGLGWYADALLPFEKAVEYGENKVDAGKNQGIYIEIFIPRNAPAGIYTGNFVLTIDGEKYNIPASVTVWDFEVSQESHLETDWIVNMMAFGELDTTAEMENTYFKTIAGYRASTHLMKSGAKDADEWLQTVRTHTNPNLRDENGKPLIGEKETYLAQINLPTTSNGTTGVDYTGFDMYISRLIKASIEDEYDYLAKTGAYMGFIDEPHLNNNWDNVKLVSKSWETRKAYWAEIIETGNVSAINEKAGSELKNDAISKLPRKFVEQLAESMRLVGNYVTTAPDEKLDKTATKQFCTGTKYLDSAKEIEAVHGWTEEKTKGNWWYAAGSMLFGNRLDSQPLEQRLSGWFTYETGLQGYLIWEVSQYITNEYSEVSQSTVQTPCDTYNTALRIVNAAGDGYIFYPGKPYGINGPVGSIRAHQYRDASEEYEYFYLLNHLYEKAGYSPEYVLAKVFSTLYNDGKINEDSDLFDFQRQQLVNLILLAQQGVFVTDYSEISGVAKLNVKTTGTDKIISIKGKSTDALTQAEISVDMTDKKAEALCFETTSGLSYTAYLGGTAEKLYDADSEVTVRGGTSEKVQLEGADATKFTFTVDQSIEEEQRNSDFMYATDKTQINADKNYLAVSLYNPHKEKISVECWFVGTSNRTVYVDDVILEPGYNEFYISKLDMVKWGTIRSITGIRFKVAPPEGMNTYSVYCSGVYAVD